METPPSPQLALRNSTSPDRIRLAVVLLSPVPAVLVALLVHIALPNRQTLPQTWMDSLSVWLHPYPILLEILLAVALLLAAAQALCQPMRPWVRHHLPLLAGAIGVLCFWDLITQKTNEMPLPYFPGPDLVFGSMVEDRAILLRSTYGSLKLLSSGYGVGVAAGIASGVSMGWFAQVRYWGMPVMKLLGPLPATALLPLAMMLSSESFIPATALIALAVWFPVTMLTASGIAGVRLSYLDVARTLGAGQWYLIFHVALPAALPHIFIGLFMGLLASFLTLTVAETVGVPAGLGVYLKLQQGYLAFANFYAALIVMAALCSGLMTLLFKVRDGMLKWQIGIIKW